LLDFAVKLAKFSAQVAETDRQVLRDVGFTGRDIWEIVSVAAFFNMTNRVASGIEMRPNADYHSQNK